MHTFFVRKCFAQLFSSYALAKGKRILAKKALLYKKRARKMLMKYTTGKKISLKVSRI